MNSKGQAVTEYILVLLVLLFIFLLLLQFNREFREWGEDTFVAYYRCLLETGEVPSLGGPNEAGVQCVGEFQPFAYRADWQAAGGGGTGGGGSGGGSSSGSDGSGGSGQTGSETATNESGGNTQRGSEVSQSSGGASGRGADRFGSRMGGSGSEAGASGSEKNKKSIYTGSNETTNFGTRGSERSSTKASGQLDYGWGVIRKKEERGEERSVASVKKEATKVQQQKRMKVSRDRIEATTETDDEGFTLGGFFRILIIAAIIIALGVLIGGQLLQITKGVDAEG